MKKNIFLVMLLIACTVSSVMAESGTIYYDYTSSDSINVIYSGGQVVNTMCLNSFATDDITQYDSISTIVSGVYGFTTMPDDTYDTQFTLKIGSDIVASGTYYIWRSRIDGKLTGNNILTFIFDSYDVSGYTGAQKLNLDISHIYMPKVDLTGTGTSVTPSEGYFKLHASIDTARYAPQKTTIYRSVDFHQNMVYDLTDDVLELTMTKNGYTNNINITDITTGTLYTQSSADDFHYVFPNIEQVLIEVENPFNNNIWSDTIPETSTSIPDEQTALIHNYVSDAVTRHLIGNGHNTTVTYDGNEEAPFTTTWPGGESHTTIDLTYGSSANLTISADGYKDSQTYHFVFSSVDTTGIWLRAGTKPVNYVYLQPIATPSNTTAYATFEVQEQLSGEQYFYSSGAAVTVGSTTLITSGLGSCSFELEAGTYPYTVKKTGFQTVSGSFSLGASNQYISVKLPKIQTAPTPTDPIGQPGVDYPYSSIDPRSQAEESIGIIFQSLPAWASLCVIVVTISFIGWMSPRKGKR